MLFFEVNRREPVSDLRKMSGRAVRFRSRDRFLVFPQRRDVDRCRALFVPALRGGENLATESGLGGGYHSVEARHRPSSGLTISVCRALSRYGAPRDRQRSGCWRGTSLWRRGPCRLSAWISVNRCAPCSVGTGSGCG